MGSALSQQKSDKPWDRLQRPARVMMLGVPEAGKRQLLLGVAPYGDAPPDLVTTLPTIGVATTVLERGMLTITSTDAGLARPAGTTRTIQNIVCANHDGIIFVVNAANTEMDKDLAWSIPDLETLVLDLNETAQAPLLLLITGVEAGGALPLDHVEAALTRILEQRRISADTYTFMQADAKTGRGFYDGLDWLVAKINAGATRMN